MHGDGGGKRDRNGGVVAEMKHDIIQLNPHVFDQQNAGKFFKRRIGAHPEHLKQLRRDNNNRYLAGI